MKIKHIVNIFCFALMMWHTATAQYRGGTKSGYEKTNFSQLDLYSAFKGGLGQGYSNTNFIQSSISIYLGGTNDGYSIANYAQSNGSASNIFVGGTGSGYSLGCYIQSNGSASNIFAGGSSDGYDKSCYAQTNLPKPVVKFTASDTTICIGTCINFTDNSDYAPTAWKWTFTGASISTSTSQNVTNVCYTTAGTYAVKLRATNSLGSDSVTKVAYITVYALPTLTMTPTTQSICTGASATLAASLTSTPGSVTYAWSGANLITNSGASVTANPTSLQNYTVVATDAISGCSRTGNTQVSVNGLPNVGVSATSTTICEGSSTQLSGSGASSYSWNNGAGNGAIVSVTPLTTTTYTVTGTNANGCTNTAQVTINVNPAPTATITPATTTTFCIGGSVSLTAASGTNYSWSPASGLNITNAATVIATPTNTTTYTVTVQGANSCTKTTTQTITVNQLPNVGVSTTNSIVCTGNSTTLNASGASTYSWNNSGTLSASSGSSVTASPTNTTTYTVTGTSAAGCSNSANTTITVNTAPTAIINTSSTNICSGFNTTLNASGATTYSWSPSGGLNTTNGATVIAAPSSTQTYTVTASNAGVGCSDTETITVIVNNNPTVSATQDGTIICPGGTVMLHASSANGNSYQWYLNNTPVFNATNADFGATVAGTYYVIVSNGNNCTGESNTLVLQGASAAQATITASGPTTFCAGGSVTLNANTGAGFTYQWYKDNNPMSGQTSTSISVSAAGFYTLDVTLNGECTTTSTPVQVIVNPYATAINTAGGPLTFCDGGAVTLFANAGANLSYDWRKVGVGFSLSNQISYAVGVSGTYTVTVNNQYNCPTQSNSIVVNVNSLPTATATPASSTNLCPSQTVVLNANTGSGLQYQWKLNGNNIPTQNASSFTAVTTGNYTVQVTDANSCSNTSSAVAVTLNTAPPASISTSTSTTFCAGGSVVLNANTGAGLTHQWKLNGNDILNATSSSYSANTSGNYSCVVTLNGLCNATSNIISVTVNPLPSPVISNTTPLSFCPGSTVTLQTTTAINQSYQWYQTIIGFGTFPINGETGTTLLQGATNATFVYVQNTITGCGANSNAISPIHLPTPTVNITNASNTTICSGSSVTLNSSATGTGLQYQWKLNGNDISLATATSYAASLQGAYSLTVTNSNSCSTTSNSIGVIVNTTPVANITETGTQNICSGGSITLNANTGAGLTHQWKLNGNDIPTAMSSNYATSTAGNYTVVVTLNGQCSATSAITIVNVNALPSANITAGSATSFCPGGSVVLNANTGANLSYQWYISSISYSGIISGQTANTLSASNDGSYSVLVHNSVTNCSNSSNAITVTNFAAPGASITAVGNTTICSGNNVTLNANTNNGTSFQWKFNGNDIIGANASNYQAATAGNYTVQITNSNLCSSISNSVQVIVNTTPTSVITANAPTTFCEGSNVTLIANSGLGITHQWQLNGNDIIGANSSTYSAALTGTYICVNTLNGECSKPSNSIVVTVNSNPIATLTALGNTTFCQNNSVTLQASSGTGFTYQYYNSIFTGNEPVTISNTLNVTSSGNYGVRIINPNGCVGFANPVSVSVNSLPNVSTSVSGNTNICPGGSVTLSVPNSVTNTYQWYVNNNIINTATNHDYIANLGGNYTCLVTNNNGCSATSSAINVYVNDGSSAQIYAVGSLNFCAGGAVTLHANHGTGLTHQWYRNASLINGATDSTYTAVLSGIYTCAVTLDNNCVSVSNNLNVDADNGPIAIITTAYPLTCLGDSLPMSCNTGLGFTYQWYKDGNVINGATNANYTAYTSGLYTIIISNGVACSNTSSPINVQLNTAPSTNIIPDGPTTFCQGNDVKLSIDNSSNQTYQWYNYTGIIFGWLPINGATDSTLTVSASGSFYAFISNSNGCTVNTSTISITVNANPIAAISANGNTNICPGGDVTLSANTGLSYHWYRNNTPINSAIQNSFSASLAGNYQVIATNLSGCSTTSNLINVYVNDGSSANIYASNPTTFCEGGNTLLHANHGQGLTHQWYFNASPIFGATDSIYNATQDGFYNCQVILDNNCTSVSNIIFLTVNPTPIANISATNNTTICAGQTTQLVATTGLGYSYQWKINGVDIPTATASTYGATTSGVYSVLVTTNNGCSNTSNSIVVTVNTNLLATATALGATTFCEGSSVQINANTGVNYTYQWYVNNNIVNSATNSTIIATSAGSYFVRITNSAGCTANSNTVSIVTNSNPTISGITGANTFCPTSNATLNAGSGYNSYQWSGPITGSSQTLAINLPGTYSVVVSNASGCTASTNVTVNSCSIGAQGIFPTSQCGYINQPPNGFMYATAITGVMSYRFDFYNVGSNTILASKTQANTTITFNTVTSPAIGSIPNTPFNWGTQYDVTVTPIMIGGIVGTPSNKCRLGFMLLPNANNIPATNLRNAYCNANPANATIIQPNATIICTNVSQASGYQYKFVNTNNIQAPIFANSTFLNQLNLSTVPALQAGNTYQVSVRASILGVQATNFGSSCYIKIAGSAKEINSNSAHQIKIDVMPNPIVDDAIILISSEEEEIVSISVNDLTGKTIGESKINSNTPTTLAELNWQLASGIYFISASFNDGTKKTIKMVKE